MHNQTNLFPEIGVIAEQTDKAEQRETDGTSGETDEAHVDSEENIMQEIESLCMNCEKQGVTRLMLTSIPFFREVIIMSFRCDHCGTSNNEVQSAGTIRPEGTVYTVKINDRQDLNRQVVRSGSCEVCIPEFELTLPPTSRGKLTTVEGLIRAIATDLSSLGPVHRIYDEEGYKKIQDVIDKLKEILGDEEEEEGAGGQVKTASEKDSPMPQFTIQLDDPAGNSFVEFVGSMADPNWILRTYHRTLEQNIALGLVAPDDEAVPTALDEENVLISDDEVFTFPGICSSCAHTIQTRMKKVNIPYFKDILIMSTNCEHCGYKDNEVKSGAAISEKGKRITLRCEDREDLSRDILKSETAGLTVPEIDLVLTHGTLGGRFTTVEGILVQIYEELGERTFLAGDSATVEETNKLNHFLSELKKTKQAERPFTIILDDPLANSYIQNLYAPDPDPNMTIEMYERTFEQNEELGLNDIKVEGYELADNEDSAQQPEEKGQ